MTFDYIGQLVSLYQRVSGEVSQVNALFPEYTPHDAPLHLNRLFDLADRIIEAKRYSGLNVAELFILAGALYGHDWGMAVSEAERQAVRDTVENKPIADGIVLLRDEKDKLRNYASEAAVTMLEAINDVTLWREYIRSTHSERSALRIRKFFNEAVPGIDDAIARVAWAHGVDIKEIEKPGAYPSDLGVNSHRVDLKSMAIYIRLIDLLDISGDRTPYAVWNFVAPRNPRSQMEWEKHRSLNAITCSEYQSARKITVDGSTNDPEVWAELQDLGRYVEEQVRGCNDLLSRYCNSRYHLDLVRVDWRINAEGFNPVDIRFEFDRDKIFQILSDEV